MKRIIWIIMFILLISSVYAIKPMDFFERIKDTDKYPDGTCSDGENFFLDEDCEFTTDMLLCKDECIFDYMWFARLGILIALIFLIFYRKEWKAILLFLGIFLSFFFIIPLESETKDLNNESNCITKYNPVCANQTYINACEAEQAGFYNYTEGKCSDSFLPKSDVEKFWDTVTSFGARVYPSKPWVGWIFIAVVLFVLFKVYEDWDFRFRNRRRF